MAADSARAEPGFRRLRETRRKAKEAADARAPPVPSRPMRSLRGARKLSLNLALLLSTLASASLALAFLALSRRRWMSALLGGPAPGVGIIVYYFYLESQAPDGPYYALIGLVYGVPALLFGLGVAVAAVFIVSEYRGKAGRAEP